MTGYDPISPVPRHRQIAAILRARIEAGELAAGGLVPSETVLVQQFGVARETARRAIRILRDEGLIVTVPGVGSFVRR